MKLKPQNLYLLKNDRVYDYYCGCGGVGYSFQEKLGLWNQRHQILNFQEHASTDVQIIIL